MRNEFKKKKLSEVVQIVNGGTPETSKLEFWNGTILWITPKDMGQLQSKFVDNTERKITEIGLRSSSAKALPPNSVILSSRAPIGHLAINLKPITTNQGCKGLVPTDQLNTLYLYYFLSNSIQLLNELGSGTTFKELSGAKLGSVEIPVPPLNEQQRIVSMLEQVFAEIEKAKANVQKNIQNAKELFENQFHANFTQNENTDERILGDVCEITTSLIDPKELQYQNLVHIGAGNIESETGTLVGLMTAKEEGLISGKFLFDETMVLYSKIRPYLKKVVNCTFSGLCSADIYPLSPINGRIIKDYLYYLLLSEDFTNYAISGSQRAGMPKVNREHLFQYSFNLPSVSTQFGIVSHLKALQERLFSLESTYNAKLLQLDSLRQSILQKAFAGQLTQSMIAQEVL